MVSTMVNTNVLITHFILKHSTQPCDVAWLDLAGHCCMNGGGLQHSRAELWCSSDTPTNATASSSIWQEGAWAKRKRTKFLQSGTATSKECTGQCGWKQSRRRGQGVETSHFQRQWPVWPAQLLMKVKPQLFCLDNFQTYLITSSCLLCLKKKKKVYILIDP